MRILTNISCIKQMQITDKYLFWKLINPPIRLRAGEWALPSRSALGKTPGSGGDKELLRLSTDHCCYLRKAGNHSDASAQPDYFYARPTVRAAISGIVGALYATMVILFAPYGFGPAQVRVADCLMPLAMVFGYSAAIGLSAGCVVANFYGFMVGTTNPVDIIGGSLANLIAAVLAYNIYKMFVNKGKKGFFWIQLPILVENIVVTLLVGSYMAVIIPLGSDLVSSLVVWYIGVFTGSLITMNFLGYAVYKMTYIGIL